MDELIYEKAKNTAFNLLAIRARSRRELESRLLSKFDAEITAEVIHTLESLSYLNDEDFALQLIESLAKRGYGKRVIDAKLYEKGISSDIRRLLLSKIDNGLDSAMQALSKKYRNAEFDRSKAYAYLARRGFSSEVCRRAITKWGETSDEDN